MYIYETKKLRFTIKTGLKANNVYNIVIKKFVAII